MVKVCVLQLNTLSMSDSRIDYYLKLAKQRGVSVVLLGEYILNSFFNELVKVPKSMIKEQSEQKKKSLFNLAKKYDLNIIAPIILIKDKDIFKAVAKFSPKNIKYQEQNVLINYPHWNERYFFSNSNNNKISLMTFTENRFKFGVIFGYEAHFDNIWIELLKKKVDCVLMPTACTLNSKDRWSELLKMRAFTNNIYILRANRLGKTKFSDLDSDFYGHSFLINPHGNILESIDENEGMLICELDKNILKEAKNIWKFRDTAIALNEF